MKNVLRVLQKFEIREDNIPENIQLSRRRDPNETAVLHKNIFSIFPTFLLKYLCTNHKIYGIMYKVKEDMPCQ